MLRPSSSGGRVLLQKDFMLAVPLLLSRLFHHRPQPLCTLDPPPQQAAVGLRAFRSSDWYEPAPGHAGHAAEDLKDLRASGSSQFNLAGLSTLRNLVPTQRLFVLDLRQESHGFDGAEALGWWTGDNAGNVHRSLKGVLHDETQRLHKLQRLGHKDHVTVYRRAHGHYVKARLPAGVACSEQDLLAGQALGYCRLPMTDGTPRPVTATVDAFVTLVSKLPKDAWLHFHCLHGHGRTTLFMALYDCWRNAAQTSLFDIIARQHALGGVDLGAKQRRRCLPFLRLFHRYCCEVGQMGRNPPPYSQWLRQQNSVLQRLGDAFREQLTRLGWGPRWPLG
jgi:hypothetical protein